MNAFSVESLDAHDLGFTAPVDPRIAGIVEGNDPIWVALISDLVRCVHDGDDAVALVAARNLVKVVDELTGARESARVNGKKAVVWVVPDLELTR